MLSKTTKVGSTGLSLISHLGLIFLSLSLASCGLTKMGNRIAAACKVADVKATFKAEVMPVFAKSCSNCHGDSGFIQTNFASSAVDSAYSRTLQIFNVGDALGSHLMEMATNGHCGSALCSPTDLGPALEHWAAVEQQAIKDKATCAASSNASTDEGSGGSASGGSSSGGPTYTLVGSLTIEAAGALSTTTYTTLTYPIPGFAGSFLTLRIRRFTQPNPAANLPGSYQITGINLISSSALRVTNLRLTVEGGGTSYIDNTFNNVNADYAAAATPGTVVSSVSTTVVQQATSGDKLKLEAVKIGAATGGGTSPGGGNYTNENCTNLAAFTTTVFNTTVNAGPTCVNCHSNGTGGLTMISANATTTCKNFKAFMVKSNPTLSAPYKVIIGTQAGHPGLNGANQLMANNLAAWAAAEQ